MIDILDNYDKRTAAGVLARAALALENGESSTESVINNEAELWAALIQKAREKFGFKPNDESPEVVERIGAYLDEESERLIGEPDTKAAIERLIVRGELPPALYKVEIIQFIKKFFGKDFEREKALIERTVSTPTREQHFGATNPEEPQLISLFAREFTTPYPARNFTMLVAGNRADKKNLVVHQAWRIYESQVKMRGAVDLVDLLRRFADVYGFEIVVNGQRGRFFFTAPGVIPPSTKIELRAKRKTEVTVSRFAQRDLTTGKMRTALVLAVDLDLYRATIKNWDCKEIY